MTFAGHSKEFNQNNDDLDSNPAAFSWAEGIYTGLWIPFSNATDIGVKPEFGLQFIGGFWRIFTSAYFGFRGGYNRSDHDRNSNSVTNKDLLYSLNYGIDGEFGLEWGIELLRFRRNQFDFIFHCGYESRETIVSTFFGPGLGYRFTARKEHKITINPRIFYRWMNSSQDALNHFSANALKVQLMITFSGTLRR
jgi:hypothetical protein